MDNKTSTFEKGDSFESEVFETMRHQCLTGSLGLSPISCQPFRKKGYYSRDRDANIIVDISIEVWPPGSDHWSFLWVCECKNYSHGVPVDDVEEFKAKLDQITGANRKGVMAISGAMQVGALKYAISNGIGIVRVLPKNQVQWIHHLKTGATDHSQLYRSEEYARALLERDFNAENRRFYGVSNEELFFSWGTLLRYEFDIPHDEKLTQLAMELARRESRQNDA